jgi:uncharacterized protein YkwD
MRTFNNNWRVTLAGAIASCFLVACGGGGGGGGSSSGGGTTPTPPVTPTDPTPTVIDVAKMAADGLNWINFRRGQLGVPALTRNAQVSVAAQAHSDYQKVNSTVTHDEISGKAGFTGVHLQDRLLTAGYVFNPSNNYAYGEIISATTSSSGEFMAEELVTAIYHRFVMFEPIFKEVGTGAAATTAGYAYFTADMTANNNYGTGVGRGNVVVWPFSGMTGVTRNFFSDNEAPDPVPAAGVNEVGYPISVHGDITAVLGVTTFTVRERGTTADLAVRLLKHNNVPTDPNYEPDTPASAMAIIPLTPLKAGTTYDVTFIGTADGTAVTKAWSFTTK